MVSEQVTEFLMETLVSMSNLWSLPVVFREDSILALSKRMHVEG
jgi:hypothetical protein